MGIQKKYNFQTVDFPDAYLRVSEVEYKVQNPQINWSAPADGETEVSNETRGEIKGNCDIFASHEAYLSGYSPMGQFQHWVESYTGAIPVDLPTFLYEDIKANTTWGSGINF